MLNVGAGTGAHEPAARAVVAVEPSSLMIAQRSRGAAPVVQAAAERLPFGDGAFDAAMALFTVHHWADVELGLHEMRRVARRIVILERRSRIDRRPVPPTPRRTNPKAVRGETVRGSE